MSRPYESPRTAALKKLKTADLSLGALMQAFEAETLQELLLQIVAMSEEIDALFHVPNYISEVRTFLRRIEDAMPEEHS